MQSDDVMSGIIWFHVLSFQIVISSMAEIWFKISAAALAPITVSAVMRALTVHWQLENETAREERINISSSYTMGKKMKSPA